MDRSEGRTIISGRNQKSFISSTLISTKVIPLARLRKFSTLILDYVAASKGPFFDLSPLFCFQTRRVFEGETFHSRSKFSSFFPSSIDGEKKFERGGVNFFHPKIEKKGIQNRTRQTFVYYFYRFILLALDVTPILQIRESIRRNVRQIPRTIAS